jgi:hypothetical protein
LEGRESSGKFAEEVARFLTRTGFIEGKGYREADFPSFQHA